MFYHRILWIVVGVSIYSPVFAEEAHPQNCAPSTQPMQSDLEVILNKFKKGEDLLETDGANCNLYFCTVEESIKLEKSNEDGETTVEEMSFKEVEALQDGMIDEIFESLNLREGASALLRRRDGQKDLIVAGADKEISRTVYSEASSESRQIDVSAEFKSFSPGGDSFVVVDKSGNEQEVDFEDFFANPRSYSIEDFSYVSEEASALEESLGDLQIEIETDTTQDAEDIASKLLNDYIEEMERKRNLAVKAVSNSKPKSASFRLRDSRGNQFRSGRRLASFDLARPSSPARSFENAPKVFVDSSFQIAGVQSNGRVEIYAIRPTRYSTEGGNLISIAEDSSTTESSFVQSVGTSAPNRHTKADLLDAKIRLMSSVLVESIEAVANSQMDFAEDLHRDRDRLSPGSLPTGLEAKRATTQTDTAIHLNEFSALSTSSRSKEDRSQSDETSTEAHQSSDVKKKTSRSSHQNDGSHTENSGEKSSPPQPDGRYLFTDRQSLKPRSEN